MSEAFDPELALLQGFPALPEPLPSPVVDGHTHLDHRRAGDSSTLTVQQALAAAASVNVTAMVQIGCDLAAAAWTVAAVDRFDQLVGGVALHPTEATKIAAASGRTGLEAAWGQIEAFAQHPRVRVVGETGLDYYWVEADDVAGRAAQRESFEWHIDLAKRTGRTLQIHDRDAHDDVIATLKSVGAPERTVFHCFSGDAAMARECLDQGWVLSFAGTLTFKNAHDLREAATLAPATQLQVETDAPYLTPMPYRGRVNGSYLVPLTVRALAQVRQEPVEELCQALWRNAQALYGPWPESTGASPN